MRSKTRYVPELVLVAALLLHPGSATRAVEPAWTPSNSPVMSPDAVLAPEAPDTAAPAPDAEARSAVMAPFLGPTPIGPVYPPPLGISYVATPGDGSYIAKSGGRSLLFTATQADRYTALYWGPRDPAAVQHALTGGALGPSTVLTLDVAQSNLPAGLGRWFGGATDPFSGGPRTTRFSLSTSTAAATLPMILGASVGITNNGAVVTVTGNFTANLLFELQVGGFIGSNDYYDSYCMPGGNPACAAYFQPILSSYWGAFWYTAPDVSLALSGSLCARQTGVLNVAVANNGPGPVTSVIVTDAIPAGLIFNSYLASQGSYSSTTGIWTVGSIPEGVTHTLSLVTSVSTTGRFTNTAAVMQYQFDPVAANNTKRLVLDAQRCSFVPSTRRVADAGW